MSVNERLATLVNTYSDGVVLQFAKRIGVSHTSIASMLPGSRESKPGFEVIAKIVEAFPEVSADWLLTGEGPMVKEGHTVSLNKVRGSSLGIGTGNRVSTSSGYDEECRKELKKAKEEVELWRGKYIALLENMAKS